MLYSSQQHLRMNKVKGSLLSSSYSMTWRGIGSTNKSNSKNWRFWRRLKKEKNQIKYTQKFLQQCKQWNGPATSVEELHTILNLNPDKREKIVQTELSFYRDTHKAAVIQQQDFFKINGISRDEQLLNLCAHVISLCYHQTKMLKLSCYLVTQQIQDKHITKKTWSK